jgi:hypothetical protein
VPRSPHYIEAAPHLCSEDPQPLPATGAMLPPSTPPAAAPPRSAAVPPPTCGPSPGAGRLRRRLRTCAPAPTSRERVDWRQLCGVIRSEAVGEEQDLGGAQGSGGGGGIKGGGFGHHAAGLMQRTLLSWTERFTWLRDHDCISLRHSPHWRPHPTRSYPTRHRTLPYNAVNVNSGGAVFFCIFGAKGWADEGVHHGQRVEDETGIGAGGGAGSKDDKPAGQARSLPERTLRTLFLHSTYFNTHPGTQTLIHKPYTLSPLPFALCPKP